MAIVTGNPDLVANPCGNCRDAMRDTLGKDLDVVSGPETGGRAAVAKLTEFLSEIGPGNTISRKASEKRQLITSIARQTLTQGRQLTDDPYASEKEPVSRTYHTLIATERNEYFGGYECMCDYHPIYSGRDALRQAKRANDYSLRYALFAVADPDGQPPDVMYMDRQHLMEYNLVGEILKDREINCPVYLATVDPTRQEVTGLWQTSVKEQLPFPFSPRNFGPDFIAGFRSHYRRKLKNSQLG